MAFRRQPAMRVPASATSERSALACTDDESVLVSQLKDGDRAAFEHLFRVYYDVLCEFVGLYVERADVAEELVQDVFVWLWEHRGTWEPREGIRTYLYGAVRNQALNHARRRRIEQRWADQTVAETDGMRLGQAPAQPDEAMRVAELDRVITRAIQDLPARRREVYILRRQHGLSQAETARTMGVSVKCVEVQFGKALQTLRRVLAAYF